MSKLPDNFDRVLDGLLTGDEKDRAERAIAGDPDARSQAELQRRIDDSLGRLFAAPAQQRPARRVSLWPLAAAAAVLLAVAGVYWFAIREPAVRLGPVYRGQVAAGFIPRQVCTTRDEFAAWMKRNYGQPLAPAEPHEGVEFVGWSYGKAVSENSGFLLARVKGKEVLVVMEHAVRDREGKIESGEPGLKSFRRQVGAMVMYEITPWDEPAILPILTTDANGG